MGVVFSQNRELLLFILAMNILTSIGADWELRESSILLHSIEQKCNRCSIWSVYFSFTVAVFWG